MTCHPQLDRKDANATELAVSSNRPARSLMLILALLASAGLQAASIVVDTDDGGGVNIDGNCSLTEALVGANFNVAVDQCTSGASGHDVIAFDASIFSGSPLFLASISLEQSLDIADGGVTMEPPGGQNLWIQAAGSNRLFTISAGDTVLRRITMNGGSSTGDGGAILINSPAENTSLQLENISANNSSADGIGGFIGGEIGAGIVNLNVFSSSFDSNSSSGNALGGGGAIGLDVSVDSGFLNIFVQDSHFSNNTSSGAGGAISVIITGQQDASFGLVAEDSVFNDNVANSTRGGGAIYLYNGNAISGQNSYSTSIRNCRFSNNSANQAGAIRAEHTPIVSASSSQVVLDRNSFIGNSSNFSAGAVQLEFVETFIQNNLFALNTSAGAVSPATHPGALRIEHDGSNNSTVSNGNVDIRANTFFQNDGNPRELYLDMPLSGSGGGSGTMTANVVQATTNTGAACVINNGANGNYSVSNIGSNQCTVGGDSVHEPSLNLQWTGVTHPIHTMAAIPEPGSAVVDLWWEPVCLSQFAGGLPLSTDLLGQRRDSGSGLPPDGDGDGQPDCDAGSIEVDAASGQFMLTVNLAGTGSGTVTSDVPGINCPGTCTASFDAGAIVDLEAFGQGGSSFAGWSGDCSGTGVCTVTMDQAREVTATFEGQDLIFSDRFSQ